MEKIFKIEILNTQKELLLSDLNNNDENNNENSRYFLLLNCFHINYNQLSQNTNDDFEKSFGSSYYKSTSSQQQQEDDVTQCEAGVRFEKYCSINKKCAF
jgi:hypothetical protein